MDESSAKRRERLNAMRLDASNQPHSQSQSASSSLPNPLLNPSSNDTNPQPLQRFDFYTDPVGSFSGSKTRNQDYNISSTIHRPNICGPRNQAPCRSPFQEPPLSGNQSPWRSPAHHSPLQYSNNNTRIPMGNARGPPPSYGNLSSPDFRPRGVSPAQHSPVLYNTGSPMGSARGTPPNPSFRAREASPYHSHSGGRGHWNPNNNEGGYYKKSMVEDPWRDLSPVIGDILVPSSKSSWMPSSINPKRLKLDDLSGARSKLSLAENLALSLEEAGNQDT